MGNFASPWTMLSITKWSLAETKVAQPLLQQSNMTKLAKCWDGCEPSVCIILGICSITSGGSPEGYMAGTAGTARSQWLCCFSIHPAFPFINHRSSFQLHTPLAGEQQHNLGNPFPSHNTNQNGQVPGWQRSKPGTRQCTSLISKNTSTLGGGSCLSRLPWSKHCQPRGRVSAILWKGWLALFFLQ